MPALDVTVLRLLTVGSQTNHWWCEDLVVIGDESLRVPVPHSARNAGTGLYREILVEKK